MIVVDRNKYTKQYSLSGIQLWNNKKVLIIPKVQRELVWTLSQKQLLIDSLLKDYDIPKLYFRKTGDGETKYEIIDGQQRINAIIEFLDNKYPLAKDADPIEGIEVAGKKFCDLDPELQIELTQRSLDIVFLEGYDDTETEETFLRLQNGTPLKAPEKRRAIAGNCRNVVENLAKKQEKFFEKYCDFSNMHFANEDIMAKILKQIIEGRATSISAQTLKKMYEDNPKMDENDSGPKSVSKAFSFLSKAFSKTENPHLKKYAVMDLAVIANEFLNIYDLSSYPELFADAYLSFQNKRSLNNEKPEEEQDPEMMSYNNATRADSLESLEYRQKYLKTYILEKMPYLATKDSKRSFTPDQRAVIYRLSDKKCALCGKTLTEDEFEADHIKPWSRGGLTQIKNGQVLCSSCNRKKTNKM